MASTPLSDQSSQGLSDPLKPDALLSRFQSRLSALCAKAQDTGLLPQDTDQPPHFVIAFSGGLDSTVLLTLLAQSVPARYIKAIYIDHQLQAVSHDWGVHCCEFAKSLGVECEVKRCTLKDTSEASARAARLAALSDGIAQNTIVLMAHHADDQAETLLFRLARGTGPAGLGGIPELRAFGRGVLIRPLLHEPRSQLEAFANKQALRWVEDPTNAGSDYDRNYLRHQLLPVLKSRWPKAISQMGQLAARMQEQSSLLNELLDEKLAGCLNQEGALCISNWSSQKESYQASLLRRFIERHTDLRVSEAECAKVVDELILAKEDAQPVIAFGAVELRRYRDHVWCVKVSGFNKQKALDRFALPDDSVVAGDFCVLHPLGVLTLQMAQSGWIYSDKVTLCEDRSGLRIKAKNRPAKTLKSLFQEAGVPPWQRAGWPIFMRDDQIVAIPGLALAEEDESNGEENLRFALTWRPF
jgi:tRNA(Ile)-lysidine synthase